MFTRVVTFTGASDIDGGLRYLQDEAAPMLRAQRGFRGVTASADRSSGVFGVLSLWETEADRDASESSSVKARDEAQRVIGGQVSVEYFEQLLLEIVQPPAIGSSLLVRHLSMPPATIDDNVGFFRQEVLPRMKASPGFCVVRNMIDRKTGEGLVGSVWADRASLETWEAASEALRGQAPSRGVSFGDISKRELIYVEMH